MQDFPDFLSMLYFPILRILTNPDNLQHTMCEERCAGRDAEASLPYLGSELKINENIALIIDSKFDSSDGCFYN